MSFIVGTRENQDNKTMKLYEHEHYTDADAHFSAFCDMYSVLFMDEYMEEIETSPEGMPNGRYRNKIEVWIENPRGKIVTFFTIEA